MTAEQTRMLKHELRTPINHIIGYSELLLEAAMDEGEDLITDVARTIQKDGQTLASLVDNHFAAFKGTAPDEVSESLRRAVTPVISAILENAEPRPDVEELWTRDCRRIQAAARKLVLILEPQEEHIP